MTVLLQDEISQDLKPGHKLWLFLDYDGTLAEFAPTPDEILPDAELIRLIRRLVKQPDLRVSVISGRRLRHIKELLPVPGLILAGTYGIEILLPERRDVQRMPLVSIRPVLDGIKPGWEALIAGRDGYFLEDKGWALALHARFAGDLEAEQVLSDAKSMLDETLDRQHWRILGGHKFLEIGPKLANKGKTVEYLLELMPWPGAKLVYFGDDDKDEEAFEAIQSRGGKAVVVSKKARPTLANYRLKTPDAVREALEDFMKARIS